MRQVAVVEHKNWIAGFAVGAVEIAIAVAERISQLVSEPLVISLRMDRRYS